MVNRRHILWFVRLWFKARRRNILLHYARYHHIAFVHKSPKRTSILSGDAWMREKLLGSEEAFVENFRMPRDIFLSLADDLIQHGGLKETDNIQAFEQLGIFLYFAGQHASSAALQERFQHSPETISRHLHHVVTCMHRLAPSYIQIPANDSPVPKRSG